MTSEIKNDAISEIEHKQDSCDAEVVPAKKTGQFCGFCGFCVLNYTNNEHIFNCTSFSTTDRFQDYTDEEFLNLYTLLQDDGLDSEFSLSFCETPLDYLNNDQTI